MFSFENLEILLFLIFPFVMIFLVKKINFLENFFSKEVLEKIYVKKQGFSTKTRSYLLIISICFTIIALARPIIDNGEIKIKDSYINVMIGLDISSSMSVDDIYPNRFEFAKNKIFDFINAGIDKKIGVVGFSSRAFLISPMTTDFSSLKYLIKNMNFEYLNLKGTSVMDLLMSVNSFYEKNQNKALVIFSDGGDNENFDKEIEFANKNNITVFIYMTASDKGGLLKTENSDMVLLKANSDIKNLALKSGGVYMNYSFDGNDMKSLNDIISSKFRADEKTNSVIKDKKEMFYYPLILAIIFFFMANFSLPQGRVK